MKTTGLRGWPVPLVLTGLLAACANGVNVGVTLPVGHHGGVGVVVDGQGRVHTRVGVSVGGGNVGAGGTIDLPPTPPTPTPKSPETPKNP